MAELKNEIDWEQAMALCEESVTNAVKTLNYGLNINRFQITDSLTYTIMFNLMPKLEKQKEKFVDKGEKIQSTTNNKLKRAADETDQREEPQQKKIKTSKSN